MRGKQKVVNIFKQAVGKRFTYIAVTNRIGFYAMNVIEKLEFNCSYEEKDNVLFVAGETMQVDQIVNIPLIEIEDVEDIEEENFELDGAEAEFEIVYNDGTKMYIQIYNQED